MKPKAKSLVERYEGGTQAMSKTKAQSITELLTFIDCSQEQLQRHLLYKIIYIPRNISSKLTGIYRLLFNILFSLTRMLNKTIKTIFLNKDNQKIFLAKQANNICKQALTMFIYKIPMLGGYPSITYPNSIVKEVC